MSELGEHLDVRPARRPDWSHESGGLATLEHRRIPCDGALDLLLEDDVGVVESALRTRFRRREPVRVVVDFHRDCGALGDDPAWCGCAGERAEATGATVVVVVVDVGAGDPDDPHAASRAAPTMIAARGATTRRTPTCEPLEARHTSFIEFSRGRGASGASRHCRRPRTARRATARCCEFAASPSPRKRPCKETDETSAFLRRVSTPSRGSGPRTWHRGTMIGWVGTSTGTWSPRSGARWRIASMRCTRTCGTSPRGVRGGEFATFSGTWSISPRLRRCRSRATCCTTAFAPTRRC